MYHLIRKIQQLSFAIQPLSVQLQLQICKQLNKLTNPTSYKSLQIRRDKLLNIVNTDLMTKDRTGNKLLSEEFLSPVNINNPGEKLKTNS